MEYKIEVREDGGGIVYHLDKKGQAFVVYNDPKGMLIKIKREGSGNMPVSLTGDFTTFEKAQQAVEKYLFEATPKKVTKKGK